MSVFDPGAGDRAVLTEPFSLRVLSPLHLLRYLAVVRSVVRYWTLLASDASGSQKQAYINFNDEQIGPKTTAPRNPLGSPHMLDCAPQPSPVFINGLLWKKDGRK